MAMPATDQKQVLSFTKHICSHSPTFSVCRAMVHPIAQLGCFQLEMAPLQQCPSAAHRCSQVAGGNGDGGVGGGGGTGEGVRHVAGNTAIRTSMAPKGSNVTVFGGRIACSCTVCSSGVEPTHSRHCPTTHATVGQALLGSDTVRAWISNCTPEDEKGAPTAS